MRLSLWQWPAAAGVALALLCAPAAAQTVKAGIDAWQRGDYGKAASIWRPLAESGSPDAAFNLGQAYRLGRGVPVDLAVAQSWLERAARKDHVEAQATLGLLLFQGGNRTGGLRWLKQAAEAGEPRAMLMYGTALFNGDGVAQDPVAAYAYVSRAAAQGLPPAKTTLAQMDEILPLEQRKKGLALAKEKAKAPAPATIAKGEPGKATPKARSVRAIPSKAAEKANSAVSPSGNWRIQLGAFSSRSSAEALFKRLSGRAPVAGRQLFLVPAGSITRLQVGPFESRSAAAAACKALAASGQACFPVAIR